MKYGIIPFFILPLLFTACDDGLGEDDSYIKIPAIFGAEFDAGNIHKVYPDSLMSQVEVFGLWNPMGIAVDRKEGILFWTDSSFKQIVRYDQKSREQAIIVSGLSMPNDIVFDPVDRMLYWCDSGSQTISRCDEWGGSLEILLTIADNVDAPMGITLDRINRHIYFTDENKAEISRCNLDGSNRVIITITLLNPHAVSYHHGLEKIYWNDVGTDEIWRSDKDGSNPQFLLSKPNPKGIALDEEKGFVYYTFNSDLYRCNLDGSQDKILFTAAGNFPFIELGDTFLKSELNMAFPEYPGVNF